MIEAEDKSVSQDDGYYSVALVKADQAEKNAIDYLESKGFR